MVKAADYIMQKSARLVIMGSWGTGKSSIVNAAFNRQVAHVGDMSRGTDAWTIYEPTKDCPICIYNTRDLEGSDEDVANLKTLIAERADAANQHDPTSPEHHAERLHAVWWVVDSRFDGKAMRTRLQDIIPHDIPLFVILNKCDSAFDKVKRQIEVIEDELKGVRPETVPVIPVVAVPEHGPIFKQCKLCQGSVLPDSEAKAYFCKNRSCRNQALPKGVPYKGLLRHRRAARGNCRQAPGHGGSLVRCSAEGASHQDDRRGPYHHHAACPGRRGHRRLPNPLLRLPSLGGEPAGHDHGLGRCLQDQSQAGYQKSL